MFQIQGRILELQLQHRHSDGTWAEMEAEEHDPAESETRSLDDPPVVFAWA